MSERMHWKSHHDGRLAACGKLVDLTSLVNANPEAVTCCNCLRTHLFRSERRLAQD